MYQDAYFGYVAGWNPGGSMYLNVALSPKYFGMQFKVPDLK